MLKVLKVSVVVVLALLVFTIPAQAREFGAVYTECGLGAIIAPNHPGVAAVTNVTWDSGTTAITSNSSSPDTCSGGKAKTAAFIYDSYDALEAELSSGSGAYLDMLTVLVGYDLQGKQEFIEALRDDFTKIVADSGYTDQSHFDQAEALYNLVYKHVDVS